MAQSSDQRHRRVVTARGGRDRMSFAPPRAWLPGGAAATGRTPRATRWRLTGADGNERLTAVTGGVLLVLLAVEGVTIVFVHPLLPVHFFVGMLIVGPVLLKAGSTGYRFARYYTGAPAYRAKGPPAPLPRLIGPFVLLSSLAVVGTGVGLAVAGPGSRELLFLHKASFVVWFALMAVHVLIYIWRVPRLATVDWLRPTMSEARTAGAGHVSVTGGDGEDHPGQSHPADRGAERLRRPPGRQRVQGPRAVEQFDGLDPGGDAAVAVLVLAGRARARQRSWPRRRSCGRHRGPAHPQRADVRSGRVSGRWSADR